MAQSQLSKPTPFNRSPLVRLLASLDIAPGADSTQTFAERLSHWVAWTDAIALSRVLHDAARAQPASGKVDMANGVHPVMDQVARVRRELTASIEHDALLRDDGDHDNGRGSSDVPVHTGGLVDYAACRRQYRAHQHTMEDRIGRLRTGVRAALSGLSPNLARLAALDAVLDVALAGHQRRLLEKLPTMLEKRFKANPAMRSTQGAPASHSAMVRTWRHCLLAELELRLQPVQGMVDSLGPVQ